MLWNSAYTHVHIYRQDMAIILIVSYYLFIMCVSEDNEMNESNRLWNNQNGFDLDYYTS